MVNFPIRSGQSSRETVARLEAAWPTFFPDWEIQERIDLEKTVASVINEYIAALHSIDEETLSSIGPTLSSTLVCLLLPRLRSTVFATLGSEEVQCTYGGCFRDRQHKVAVVDQLTDVIRYWAAGLVYGYDLIAEAEVTAVLLVETTLAEVGQDLLDKAVSHAPQISLCLRSVGRYLRRTVAGRPDFGEETCRRIAEDCLSLILQVSQHDLLLALPAAEYHVH